MELRKGYKQTDLGLIPEDWKLETLGNCLLRSPGYGINAPAVEYRDDIPQYIRITDITESGKYNPGKKVSVAHASVQSYYLEESDIVFARTGASVGKTYLYNPADGALVFAGFLIRVKPDTNRLIPFYLFSFLHTRAYWKWVQTMSVRSGQPGINGNEYATLPIPLPPTKAEQTAIATALSDTDALITSLEKLIVKKRAIKQGAMQELLTGKKRLPGFSGKWEVKKLGKISDIIMGQSPKSEFYNSKGIGLPLIQGNADIKNRKTIVRIFTSSLTKKGKTGDIVMSVRAPVGEISKATFDCCLGRGVCAISYKNDFLYHYLIYFENFWIKLSKGSTFDSINSKEINELELSIPKMESEQTAIAAILSDMDSEIESLEKKLSKYRLIKHGMMQELLTGKTRLV